ncbi:MFS transporter [Aeromicrobium sp.]|uniref:MFS transporter n=1 Tax=Aeromicrobium sp. TaxID=1871063 RepID=UPI0019960DD3|nr:MFS transporter [Aeromicrobium sp.]MBC7632986.1 MFS transporter [Aeromicrobium sp.]
MSPMFQALAIRNYRVYMAGSIISNTGTWMQRVAQDWLVLQLTHSGTALGIVTGLQLLPALLLSPIAGVVADRVPKRTILRFTQLAMAAPAAMLGMLAVTGVVQTWHVYVLAFVFGIGTAFDAPARQSFVVEIVGRDDLANAVGLNSASFNVARMIGPALAGVLIAALGSGTRAAGWVILVNAISYVAVFISLQLLDGTRLRPSPIVGTRKGAVREGVTYVRSRPDLVLIMCCVFFVGTFGMNFQMTSALMATEVFHKGAGEYGLLASIMAFGSLGGALLAARRTKPRLRFVVLAGGAFSLVEIASGLMPSYVTFAAILPVLGLCALTMVTSANAMIQMTSSPMMRGRVAALYLMIFLGGSPFGSPLVGWVGEAFGARWMLIGGGAVSLVGIIVATAWYASREDVQNDELRTAARNLPWGYARRANIHGVQAH